jgi:hypothetical protein
VIETLGFSETRPSDRKRSDLFVATSTRTIDGIKVTAGITRVAADHEWAGLDCFALATSSAGRAAVERRTRSRHSLPTSPASEAWRIA